MQIKFSDINEVGRGRVYASVVIWNHKECKLINI